MLIKSFTHEIASREEFHMVKITEQVKKDVEESGVKNGVVFLIYLRTADTCRRPLCSYAYAAQLWNLQRQRSGTFKIHAVRKSLCSSGF